MIERIRSTLADCLSLPKTIGRGPTMMTAPPLFFPVPVFAREARKTKMARRTPATMRIVPRTGRTTDENSSP